MLSSPAYVATAELGARVEASLNAVPRFTNGIDGDGRRREFGLRGRVGGLESDKGTAENSLSGYHAPGG
jgi:hypothetical protein